MAMLDGSSNAAFGRGRCPPAPSALLPGFRVQPFRILPRSFATAIRRRLDQLCFLVAPDAAWPQTGIAHPGSLTPSAHSLNGHGERWTGTPHQYRRLVLSCRILFCFFRFTPSAKLRHPLGSNKNNELMNSKWGM